MTSEQRIGIYRRKIPQWRNDPTLFFKQVLLFEPDDWQKNAARDLAAHAKVTIRSGQGIGKTAFEAACALWFLTCHKYARVVATAPTMHQLHDILWAEISKWQSKSPLLSEILKWTKTKVYVKRHEQRWFAVAQTATKAENMQGFHEDNMLFIVDEASGVADPILEAILGTLSGKNNKLLLCGNPTKTSGVFYDSHTKDRYMYKAHKVNAEDSPRTNRENIAALKRKYGEESNVVRVRVLGEFPLAEDDVFIPLSMLEASVNTEADIKTVHSIHIGCDVARFGDDKTVIGYKVNEKVVFHKKIQGQDLMRTAADIVILGQKLIKKYGYGQKIPIKVDVGGVGGGVIDRLKQIKENEPDEYWWMEIIPIYFGQPIKHRYYHDSTTYMMGVVRSLLSPYDEDGNTKPVELVLPDDSDLIGQLSSRKYSIKENSKTIVESKKAMKARDLPSPDEADCVLLLCCPVRIKNGRRK